MLWPLILMLLCLPATARLVKFESRSAALSSPADTGHPEVRPLLEQINEPITGPEKTQGAVRSTIKPLTVEEKARFDMGKELYLTTCGVCHQPNGNGQDGLAPPLRDSEWTVGSQDRLIRLALHGVRGPITVKGKHYDLDMPPMAILNDEQISNILTYIRREWGHIADPVDKDAVAKIREATADREDFWTEKELLRIP